MSSSKKVGIMTYWTSHDNYGQQMQGYALQVYLRKLGLEPYLIRYDMSGDQKRQDASGKIAKRITQLFSFFIPGNAQKWIKNKKAYTDKKNTLNRELAEHPRKFEEFRSRYLAVSDMLYTSYQQLKTDPPEADIYMAGSDQIWHFPLKPFQRSEAEIRTYMLDFGSDEVKRISVAASWGRISIPEDWKTSLRPLLRKFDAVTVREASGIALCSQCGREAVLAADPTLYLEAGDYRALYQDNTIHKPEKAYVMVYWVNNGGIPPMEKIFHWADEKGLSVEYVTANGMVDQYTKNYATIPEWLYLIDHAEYVITNSFHACVFSLLFGKKFGAIKIEGSEKGMNDRMDSLFRCCHVSPRYVFSEDFSCMEAEPEKIEMDSRLRLKEAISRRIIL